MDHLDKPDDSPAYTPERTLTDLGAKADERPRGNRWVCLPRSRFRRWLFLGAYLAFCWGLANLSIRLFWMYSARIPLGQTAHNIDFFYGDLRAPREAHPRHADEFFDVLLLGGSVLTPEWGDVPSCLSARLGGELGDRFRLFNLARPGLTSRDSLHKYMLLADEEFDLVVVYDGINDVRMNCCPSREFRDDYSHCSWYSEIERLLGERRLDHPARIGEELDFIRRQLTLNIGINEELMAFGAEIKTDQTLKRNHQQLIDVAANRGDKILLMTFAYDIPPNFRELMEARSPTFGDRPDSSRCAPEQWGLPQNVVAALDAQNAVIRELAQKHDEVLFIDAQAAMPVQQGLFVDACHLSAAGSQRFVEMFWSAVEQRASEWKAAREADR
jgi:GDSL-like Lipase/Acylhydrolase family